MKIVRRSLVIGASLAVMVASMQGVAQAGESARVAASEQEVSSSGVSSSGVSASGRVGGAGDAAAVDRRLRLALQDMDGTRLDRVALKGKGRDAKIVVGERFRATGRVPRALLKGLAGDSVVLQSRLTGGGQPWRTVVRAKVGGDGSFAKTVRVTKKRFLHQHRYRVIATTKQKASFGAGSVSAAATTTTATSPTTTATGVVEFTINYTNSTGQDLVVFVPTAQTSEASNGQADYDYGSFDLDKNQTAIMTYTNPPEGTSVSWYVNQQNCFGKCTDYKPNWSQGQTPKSITCSSSAPNFPSGSTTNVDLTSQFGAGYGGSIVGPEANCSFQLGSGFQNWWENHPVEGWIAAAVAVVIIAVLVVLAIPTGGGDLVVAGETLDVTIESSSDSASWSSQIWDLDTGTGS